jgi:hypothetical protein
MAQQQEDITAQDILDEIEELQQEAAQAEQEAREKIKKCYIKIGDKYKELAAFGVVVMPGGQAVTHSTVLTKFAATGTVQKRKPATSSISAKKTAQVIKPNTLKNNGNGEKKDKVSPSKRNYGSELSLRKAIWDVLDREPETYKQYLSEYPDDAVGLRVSEMKEIIEKEGKFRSSSKNISPMIQQQVGNFKKEGKIARGDDRRYFIVDGAELDGPALSTASADEDDNGDE